MRDVTVGRKSRWRNRTAEISAFSAMLSACKGVWEDIRLLCNLRKAQESETAGTSEGQGAGAMKQRTI